MRNGKTAAARARRSAAEAADPRYVPFARLLARIAATRDFEESAKKEELIAGQRGAYPVPSPSEDSP